MASIINASVASSGIVSTADASGILLCQSNGVNTNARAWVNFVGSTAAINSSYNISSVTRQSTGNWTVSFTNAMSDAYYSVQMSSYASGNVAGTNFGRACTSGGTQSASSFNPYNSTAGSTSSTGQDDTWIMCTVFR
jgi:hypothetical protein